MGRRQARGGVATRAWRGAAVGESGIWRRGGAGQRAGPVRRRGAERSLRGRGRVARGPVRRRLAAGLGRSRSEEKMLELLLLPLPEARLWRDSIESAD